MGTDSCPQSILYRTFFGSAATILVPSRYVTLQYVNKQLTLHEIKLLTPKSVWLLDHSAAILWPWESLFKMLRMFSSWGTFAILLLYSNKQPAVYKIYVEHPVRHCYSTFGLVCSLKPNRTKLLCVWEAKCLLNLKQFLGFIFNTCQWQLWARLVAKLFQKITFPTLT